MEMEFDVKITAGVLYDYMLRHTYYSAAGLIGSMVGALMVVGYFLGGGFIFLIAGTVILAYLPWTLFLKAKQQMAATPAFKTSLHYRLSEKGIEVSQGREKQMQEWSTMFKAVSTQKSVIVYTTPVNATIFPKRDLGENTVRVIEMISTHMPPGKVKIKG